MPSKHHGSVSCRMPVNGNQNVDLTATRGLQKQSDVAQKGFCGFLTLNKNSGNKSCYYCCHQHQLQKVHYLPYTKSSGSRNSFSRSKTEALAPFHNTPLSLMVKIKQSLEWPAKLCTTRLQLLSPASCTLSLPAAFQYNLPFSSWPRSLCPLLPPAMLFPSFSYLPLLRTSLQMSLHEEVCPNNALWCTSQRQVTWTPLMSPRFNHLMMHSHLGLRTL